MPYTFQRVLKTFDQFRQPVPFLIKESYSSSKNRKLHTYYSSWPGFFLTVMIVILLIIYVYFSLENILSHNLDTLISHTFKMSDVDPLVAEGLFIKDYNFLPSLAVKLYNKYENQYV